MTVLVDSNVLPALATEDATWRAWTETTLSAWASRSKLAINAIIYTKPYRTYFPSLAPPSRAR